MMIPGIQQKNGQISTSLENNTCTKTGSIQGIATHTIDSLSYCDRDDASSGKLHGLEKIKSLLKSVLCCFCLKNMIPFLKPKKPLDDILVNIVPNSNQDPETDQDLGLSSPQDLETLPNLGAKPSQDPETLPNLDGNPARNPVLHSIWDSILDLHDLIIQKGIERDAVVAAFKEISAEGQQLIKERFLRLLSDKVIEAAISPGQIENFLGKERKKGIIDEILSPNTSEEKKEFSMIKPHLDITAEDSLFRDAITLYKESLEEDSDAFREVENFEMHLTSKEEAYEQFNGKLSKEVRDGIKNEMIPLLMSSYLRNENAFERTIENNQENFAWEGLKLEAVLIADNCCFAQAVKELGENHNKE